jgi:ferredoxin
MAIYSCVDCRILLRLIKVRYWFGQGTLCGDSGKDRWMSKDDLHMHYVCTHYEAEKLIKSHTQFWVSNCGCRELRGGCNRSRLDVCLMFKGDTGASGSGLREISPEEARAILAEANDKMLVARPFRNMADMSETEGICFCCDDCCGYFLDKNEICDKGSLIAFTHLKSCSACGDCIEYCHFGARYFENKQITTDYAKCYGCGLCAIACPETCIDMVPITQITAPADQIRQ